MLKLAHCLSLITCLLLAQASNASVLDFYPRPANKAEKQQVEAAVQAIQQREKLDVSSLRISAYQSMFKKPEPLAAIGLVTALPQRSGRYCRANQYRIEALPGSATKIEQPGYYAWLAGSGDCAFNDDAISFSKQTARHVAEYVFKHRDEMTQGATRLMYGVSECHAGFGKRRPPIKLDHVEPEAGSQDIRLYFRPTPFQGVPPMNPDFRGSILFHRMGQDYLPWTPRCHFYS